MEKSEKLSLDWKLKTKQLQWTNTSILLIGALLLLVLALFSLTIGAFQLPFITVCKGFLPVFSAEVPDNVSFLLWQIRLPRTLMAILVGASLATAGAALQGLFRNPLADPGLVGVTGGSMLAAVAFIVLGSSLGFSFSGWNAYLGLSTFALGGGLLTTFFVYRLSTEGGQTYTATMLLAGVAITAICGALTGLLTYFSTESQLRDISFWSLGSLSGANWPSVFVLAGFSALGLGLILRLQKPLDAMMLGEQEAAYLGIRVESSKWQLIFGVTLLVGASVAVAGMIGFIGLVTPHVLRLWRGGNHQFLLPASALLGAILLLLADIASRVLLAPAELPIGILTALFGAPFFFWLILRSRGQNRGIL